MSRWRAFSRAFKLAVLRQVVSGELQQSEPKAFGDLVASGRTRQRDNRHADLGERIDVAQDRSPRHLESGRQFRRGSAASLKCEPDSGEAIGAVHIPDVVMSTIRHPSGSSKVTPFSSQYGFSGSTW